MKQADLAGVQR